MNARAETDGARDDGLQQPVNRTLQLAPLGGDEADDPLGSHADLALQETRDRLGGPRKSGRLTADDLPREVLVARGVKARVMHGLEHVREGVVADIVEQRRHENGQKVLFSQAATHMAVAQESVQVSRRGSVHTQAVLKPRVRGPGVDP